MYEVEMKYGVFRRAHNYVKLVQFESKCCGELSSILSSFWGANNKLTHN